MQKLKRIGSGTYGSVYSALSPENKKCALKISKDGYADSTLKELKILSFTNHPNVIKMIDFMIESEFSLVLELGDEDLHHKHFHGKDLLNITCQLINGLAYLHQNDILHGDIKPQNILIKYDPYSCSDFKVMYIDFGISEFGFSHLRSLDLEVITLWYRPLEMLLGNKVMLSADVWSLGCTLYEIATGKPLIPGDSEIDAAFKIFRIFGTPTEETWPGITNFRYWKDTFPTWQADDYFWHDKNLNLDPDFKDLLLKMLTIRPESRPTASSLTNHNYFEKNNQDKNNQGKNNQEKSILNRNRFTSCYDLMLLRKVPLRTNIDISDYNRILLFKWVYHLKQKFRLHLETLFLALDFFDENLNSKLDKFPNPDTTTSNTKLDKFLDPNTTTSNAFLDILVSLRIADILSETYNVDIDDYLKLIDDIRCQFDHIFEEQVKIIGKTIYRSTCYDFLQAYAKALPKHIKNIAIFYLFIIRMNKLLNKYSPEIMTFAALRLALVGFPLERIVYLGEYPVEADVLIFELKEFLNKYEYIIRIKEIVDIDWNSLSKLI